ncbi:MAG TPA: fatty acid desaturase [Thiotrichales bacterium]|nr:fatty acid desaturase [Thiotrichales bacterium]
MSDNSAARTASIIDRKQLAEDISAIQKEVIAETDPLADMRHLRKMEWWGRLCTLLGYATAWLLPNPVSALLISQGIFTRWTMVTHPVSHRSYDNSPAVPKRFTSQGFARGWRRFLDWGDWIHPQAWSHEHNRLHHYNLGEATDPDHLQYNMRWLRQSKTPMWLRYCIVALFACFWKAAYYSPKALMEWRKARAKKNGEPALTTFFSREAWSFFSAHGRELWFGNLLPYIGFRFVLIPALFFPLGQQAMLFVLINSLLAEALTNLHAFLVIVPNHAGDDVPLFQASTDSKGEFFFRQIVGSVNYPAGSDGLDFFHGGLNYQIEHHLWPKMSLCQYRRAQPRVRELCERKGIPYIQESVFRRLKKAVDIMVGRTSMLEQPLVS